MTKTIELMRHGEVDPLSFLLKPGATENDMTLSEQGKMDVDLVAKKIAAENLIPDVIYHSPLTRALETAQRLRDAFNRISGKEIPLVPNDHLAEATAEKSTSISQLLEKVDDKAERILAVTHDVNIGSLSYQFNCRSIFPEKAEINVFTSEADSWKNVSVAKHTKKLDP